MGSSRADVWERLGRLDAEVARLAGRRPIWLHAASVGEVLSAAPLVECLRRDEPEHPLFATTTSITGRAAARERLGLPATLLPVDLPPIVGRALDLLRPAALVILETEIWPILIRQAARRGVPVSIVSGRISPRAAAAYTRLRPVFARALSRVSVVAAQTQDDAERFALLGVPRDRLVVLGSLKLARRANDSTATGVGVDFGERPVVIAASTQPGEEQAIIAACRELWARHPDLLLVLAPRRPERFAEVARLLDNAGIRYSRRSAAASAVERETQIFLVDTVGELANFLASARAAFVGGTLAPIGGHNVLEPAAYGVPVCFGPHLDNVREAADLLLECGGGVLVHDANELARALGDVLDDPAAGRARGTAARLALERRSRVAEDVGALVRRSLRSS